METYNPKKWLTAKVAAKEAGVTPGRIWQLGDDGTLQTMSILGRTVYRAADVRRYKRDVPKCGRPRSGSGS